MKRVSVAGLMMMGVMVAAGCGSGGAGISPDTSQNVPTVTKVTPYSGDWGYGKFTYSMQLHLVTTDNVNYTGHVIYTEFGEWPNGVNSNVEGDISGKFAISGGPSQYAALDITKASGPTLVPLIMLTILPVTKESLPSDPKLQLNIYGNILVTQVLPAMTDPKYTNP